MLRKLIAAGDVRRTRFHTEENALIPLREAAADLPVCIATKLFQRKGNRPARPWWPTRVIPLVEAFLTKDHDVIEFGSGSSTLWLAAKARSVTAMEASPKWCEITDNRARNAGLTNVTVHFSSGAAYWSPPKATGPFDLAIVDGDFRWKCIEHILPRMKPGGLVYLDNADSDKDLQLYNDNGPRRRAQILMQTYLQDHPGARLDKVKSLIDGELFAGEGWLLYLP